MEKILILLAVFLGFSYNSHASSLSTTPTDTVFEEVKLIEKASLKMNDTTVEFKKVNHGLRKKAVFGLVPVRVYVVEFLAKNPEKLNKTEDGVLASLKDTGPVLLHITFLRDLPGSKISDAFTDGLKANKINMKPLADDLAKVLEEIKNITEFKKGDTFSILAQWTDKGGEIQLHQKSGDPKIISGGPDFVNQFLSIWFGTASDSKLESLKKDLIK